MKVYFKNYFMLIKKKVFSSKLFYAYQKSYFHNY